MRRFRAQNDTFWRPKWHISQSDIALLALFNHLGMGEVCVETKTRHTLHKALLDSLRASHSTLFHARTFGTVASVVRPYQLQDSDKMFNFAETCMFETLCQQR